jgi:mevalonate kinase
MWLVNTGTPSTTTGEAVSAVAKAFGAGAPIWEEFGKTAGRMEGALERNDGEGFRGAVRDNERLLEEIGVVPGKVAEFAREVEAAGGAAKVCGAGAVGGDGGGVVLATGEKSPAELCAKYGYELMTVRADPMGVRVV